MQTMKQTDKNTNAGKKFFFVNLRYESLKDV